MVYLKCSDVVTRISAILDGEASRMTQMRFYGHIMMCKNCRRYLDQFRRVKELTGKVSSDDLPEDFDQVMTFVMDEIEQENVKDGR